MIHAGLALGDITPPLGTPCALGLDNAAIEVLDPAYIRTLAISDGETEVFLVCADVIGLYRYEDRAVRAQVAQALGVPFGNVVLHATHTHQSPNVRVQNGRYLARHGLVSYSPEFWEAFKQAAARTARAAREDLRDATVRYGEAPVRGIAGNRRLRRPDGSVIMRGSRDTSLQRRAYPEGYIDPLVRVLCFERAGGGIMLSNYCCHPTASGGDEGPYITGDFPAYALACLESEEPGLRGIYLTGPCGDVNPGKYTGTRSRQEDARVMGEELCRGMLQARGSAQPVDGGALEVRTASVRLPLHPDMPSEEELERRAEEGIAAYIAAKQRGESLPGGGPVLNALCRLYCGRECEDDLLPAEVTGIRLGDLLLFALPGECFLELDHAIRGRYVGRRVICAENCDYSASYVPVPEAFADSARGYEGNAANVGPEAFGILATAACEMWE